MIRGEVDNEAYLMRELARSAIWDLLYHERELIKAHNVVACAQALLERCGYDFTLRDAIAYLDDESQEHDPANPTEWAKCVIGSAANGTEYHEEQLQKAHKMIAATKALQARCNYPDIKWDEIYKEVEADIDERSA